MSRQAFLITISLALLASLCFQAIVPVDAIGGSLLRLSQIDKDLMNEKELNEDEKREDSSKRVSPKWSMVFKKEDRLESYYPCGGRSFMNPAVFLHLEVGGEIWLLTGHSSYDPHDHGYIIFAKPTHIIRLMRSSTCTGVLDLLNDSNFVGNRLWESATAVKGGVLKFTSSLTDLEYAEFHYQGHQENETRFLVAFSRTVGGHSQLIQIAPRVGTCVDVSNLYIAGGFSVLRFYFNNSASRWLPDVVWQYTAYPEASLLSCQKAQEFMVDMGSIPINQSRAVPNPVGQGGSYTMQGFLFPSNFTFDGKMKNSGTKFMGNFSLTVFKDSLNCSQMNQSHPSTIHQIPAHQCVSISTIAGRRDREQDLPFHPEAKYVYFSYVAFFPRVVLWDSWSSLAGCMSGDPNTVLDQRAQSPPANSSEPLNCEAFAPSSYVPQEPIHSFSLSTPCYGSVTTPCDYF